MEDVMDKKTAWVTFAAAALQGLNANPEFYNMDQIQLVSWACESAYMMLEEYEKVLEED